MTTRPTQQPLGHEHASTGGEDVPRMPHERDESSDQTPGAPPEIGQKAHDDAVSSKVDTSRGEATDKTYRDNLRGRPKKPRP